jgi:type I restriction enzyme S subunit
MTLAELLADGLFLDGDWVESKDQDQKGAVRLIQLADIGDGTFRNRSRRFLTTKRAHEMGCTFLEVGDILVARMPEPLGRACIFPGVGQAAVTAVDICIMRPNPARLSRKWLVKAINSPQFRESMQAHVRGTTRQRISRKNLGTLTLNVPNISEQHALAQRLDKFDEPRASARDHLRLARETLDRFRQSVLAAAASGRLTRGWRAMQGIDESEAAADDSSVDQGSLPFGWQRATPREICDAIVDCPHSTPKYGGGERFAIDTNSMSNRGIDLTRLRRVTTEAFIARNRRLEPSPGDIVFAREGTVGTAVELPESPRVCLGQRVMLMRPGQKVLPGFLRLALMSPLVRQQYVQKILGTTAPHLNVRDVLTLGLLIPPLDEQSEIVRTVGTLLALTDEATTRIESAFSSSESCMQSFLARTFHVATNWNEAEDSNGSVKELRITQ